MTAKVRVAFDISASKITKYLLDPTHHRGRSKADYLMRFGFSPQDPNTLAVALVRHAIHNLPGVSVKTPRGPNHVVLEGTVLAPDGRQMPLRTVWEPRGSLQSDPLTLRFITAVPLTR